MFSLCSFFLKHLQPDSLQTNGLLTQRCSVLHPFMWQVFSDSDIWGLDTSIWADHCQCTSGGCRNAEIQWPMFVVFVFFVVVCCLRCFCCLLSLLLLLFVGCCSCCLFFVAFVFLVVLLVLLSLLFLLIVMVLLLFVVCVVCCCLLFLLFVVFVAFVVVEVVVVVVVAAAIPSTLSRINTCRVFCLYYVHLSFFYQEVWWICGDFKQPQQQCEELRMAWIRRGILSR